MFFKGMSWVDMEKRLVPPPYVPPESLDNFDTSFTTQEVCLTPPDPYAISAIDQDEFAGFTFTAKGTI